MLVFSCNCLKLFYYYTHSPWVISSMPRIPRNTRINDSLSLHLQASSPKLYFQPPAQSLPRGCAHVTLHKNIEQKRFTFQCKSISLQALFLFTVSPSNQSPNQQQTSDIRALPVFSLHTCESSLNEVCTHPHSVSVYSALGTLLGIRDTKTNMSQSLLLRN